MNLRWRKNREDITDPVKEEELLRDAKLASEEKAEKWAKKHKEIYGYEIDELDDDQEESDED